MRTRYRAVPRAVTAGARRALAAAAVLAIGALAPPSAHASRLLVSSALNSRLLRFDGQTGAFTDLFAPTGSGGFNYPEGIAFGPDGNLYVRSSGSILRFNGATGASMGTFATSNGQDPSSYAFQVRLDGGSFVATPATGGIDGPTGLVFGPDGSLFVSSYGSILRYSGLNGTPLGTFCAGGGLVNATGLTFGPDGNLYVSSFPGNIVIKYNGTTGALLGTFVTQGSGGLDRPIGLTFGPDNNLYVCSYNTNSVLRYNGTTGAFMGVFTSGGGLNGPTGLDFGPDNNLYVASYGSSSVPRFDGTTGAFTDYFVPSASNGLSGPFSVCFNLESPTNLTASAASPTQINLSWTNNSPDDTGVEIDRKLGGGAYTVVAVVSPTTTSYTDSGLNPNTPYSYRVRAVSNTLFSGFTAEASVSTQPGVPSAPSNLTATASPTFWNQISLSWSGDGSGATSFEIYRKTGGGAYALAGTVASNVTSYVDIAINAGTSYTYEVRAVNSSFASAYTNEATATTIQSPPAAPTGLTATASTSSSTQITLNWTDNSTNETGYEIYRKTGAGSYSLIRTVAAGVTSYADSGLSAATAYTYKVRAVNNNFASAYTNEASATTVQLPPAAPTSLTATASTTSWTQITLNWTDNSTNETGYEIYRKTGAASYSLIGTVAASVTSYADSGLSGATTYTYEVRAVNSNLASAYTNEASATTIQPPPATPTGLAAVATGAQIKLNWTDNSTNEAAFEIWRKAGSGNWALASYMPANSTSFTDASVSGGVSYTYTVRAINATLTSAFATAVTVTANIIPTIVAPSGLAAVPVGATIQLNWTDNSTNETAFEIWRKVGSGNWALASYMPANSTSFTDASVSGGVSYTYTIRATNPTLASSFATAVTVTANTVASIAAPDGLAAVPAGATVQLSWNDNSTNETAFEIWRKAGSGNWALASYMPAGATSFTDANVSGGVSYTYTVRAINSTLASAFATAVTVTANTIPTIVAPSGLAAVPVGGMVQLSWTDNSTNETAFEIWRKVGSGNWALASYMPAGASSFTDANVSGGVSYTYTIRATNPTLASSFATAVTVTAGP